MERIREHQRQRLEVWLAPMVRWLAAHRVHPNLLSAGNVAFSVIAAVLTIQDQLTGAGVIFLVGSTMDMLDGMVARVTDRVTHWGAFLDSTLDRVCEGVVFAAVAWWLAAHGETWAVAALVLAVLGSMLTSYTRARAEALGFKGDGGWVTRPERVILIGLGLITHQLALMVYLMMVLTLWTSGQRIAGVYQHFKG